MLLRFHRFIIEPALKELFRISNYSLNHFTSALFVFSARTSEFFRELDHNIHRINLGKTSTL